MMDEENEEDYLTVTSFDPNRIQFRINDEKKWRKGKADLRLQIGSFVKIKDGNERLIVAQILSYQVVQKNTDGAGIPENSVIITAKPLGQLEDQHFIRGIKNISIPPQGVEVAKVSDIITIFSHTKTNDTFSFGKYNDNGNVHVELDGNKFFSKHIAILGSTGSGKSCTVATIIQKIKKRNAKHADGVLNNSHVVIFDVHGEYKSAFPNDRFLSVDTINENDKLRIPYWLLKSEELEDIFIENSELNAYNQIAQFKTAVIENKKKWNPTLENVDYDMPVFFSISEVFNYIYNKNFETHFTDGDGNVYYADNSQPHVKYSEDNYQYLFEKHRFRPTSGTSKDVVLGLKVNAKRNGFLGEFTRFITRFQAKLNDVRLSFLLKEPDNVEEYKNTPEKTFSEVVPNLFGHRESENNNITIIDLSALPFEVVSIIVSVISRLAFDVCYYQTKIAGNNTTPLMLVYEEAHRYIPKNGQARYKNTREAVERIAKEGRKYGISEMIVSQRPSEISDTVLSQCNNFVVMKLSNQDDRNIVRSVLPDTDSFFVDSLSSLNKREALVAGDAFVNSCIVRVDTADPTPNSGDVKVYTQWQEDWMSMMFNKAAKQILNIDD